jgi:hypothetical protein
MTAPGMNLEFTASGAFRNRVGGVDGLLDAVKHWHRDHPLAPPGLADCVILHQGHAYGVIFRRKGNRIGLIEVFGLPQEAGLFTVRYQALRKMYGSGRKEAS